MSKPIKIVLIVFLVLLALLVIGVGIVAATFNPNDYKPMIIKLVQEKKQRTLAIPGEIKLSFFPKIGADLGQISISEYKGAAEFAAINSAKVSLELIPLLSKKLVVDRVMIDGLRASITRHEDRSTNFDDLLAKDEEESEQFAFNIDSINITNASVKLDDRQQHRSIAVSALNLETGQIANGASSKLALSATIRGDNPVIDAKLALKSGFLFDLDQNHFVLSGADGEFNGTLMDFRDLALKFGGDADLKPADKRFALEDIQLAASGKRAAQRFEFKLDAPELGISDTKVAGAKVSGEARLVEGARSITASFSAPSFEGTPQAFKVASMTLDAAIKDTALDAKARISGALTGDIDKLIFTSPQLKLALSGQQGGKEIEGSLSTPLAANLQSQIIELPNIAAAFTLPNPGGGSLKLNADGRASINLDKQTVSAMLKGKLDESMFDARLGLSKFSPPSYTFDIGIDRLDADRYQSKQAKAADKGSKSGTAGGSAAEQPIDLSALRDLQAAGSLRVGALTVNKIKASNVRLDVRAASGKLDVSALSAKLYGGSVNGSLSATASTPPRFAMRQNLADIHVGPLLKDAMGKAPIEGRGNVQLDITAAGATVTQIKKALNGSASMVLRDGTVRGINIAQTVRSAKTRIDSLRGEQSAQSGTASAEEKTDFSELSASFSIANGVARNKDLSAKSPLIRVAGAGDINLGADRLDYLVKATVVSTLQGQGGPELQALKGLTIPVKLSGPFSAIGWKVDVAGLAKEAAKEKIEEKKDELREKARDKIQDQLKGLFGK